MDKLRFKPLSRWVYDNRRVSDNSALFFGVIKQFFGIARISAIELRVLYAVKCGVLFGANDCLVNDFYAYGTARAVAY